MRNLFEDQYGTSVTSVVSASATEFIDKDLFPLGKFDIRAIAPNASEDDAFFVTVDPSAGNWHALLSEQLTRATGIAYATLVDARGVAIDPNDVSGVVDAYTQLFTVVEGAPDEKQIEEQIGVKITSAMSLDEQMHAYAKALAKRVYETNNAGDLRRFVKDRSVAMSVAVATGKHKGLDAVLAASFGARRSEFYARVATYIRANVRTAIGVLEHSRSPLDHLRRTFVDEFLDVSFQGWIESSLGNASLSSDSESSSTDEDFTIAENIDCEYDSYSDVVNSDDDEEDARTPLGAKFSTLKKAIRNVAKRSDYVTFKLRRYTQGDELKEFSWLGSTALEPGDVIHTFVHAAKPEGDGLLKRKKKTPKELPTSVIVDFQMRNRREPSSSWLTVQTVEVLLPASGKIEGPMFAVPLDDQAFRIVISTRRPNVAWHMVDVVGVYEFTVDAYGTKSASRRNYPVTWEQVRVVRYNPELRAKYSIPEFVFHARLSDTEPKPFKRKLTGEIVDYFDVNDQQKVEEARQASLAAQQNDGVQQYFDVMRKRVDFKAYSILEVRHVIWALNNNMSYTSEYLRDALKYDDEYEEAMKASIDARISDVRTLSSRQRYQRQMKLGQRPVVEEESATIDAMIPVWMPPEPRRTSEVSEDAAFRFGAGVQYAAPGVGRDITVSNLTRARPRKQTATRAKIAPAPVAVVAPTPQPVVQQQSAAAIALLAQLNAENAANQRVFDGIDRIIAVYGKHNALFSARTRSAVAALGNTLAAIPLPKQNVTVADERDILQTSAAYADITFQSQAGELRTAIDVDIGKIKSDAQTLVAGMTGTVPVTLNTRLLNLSQAVDDVLAQFTETNVDALVAQKRNFDNAIASSSAASSSTPPPPSSTIALDVLRAENERKIDQIKESLSVSIRLGNKLSVDTSAAAVAVRDAVNALPKMKTPKSKKNNIEAVRDALADTSFVGMLQDFYTRVNRDLETWKDNAVVAASPIADATPEPNKSEINNAINEFENSIAVLKLVLSQQNIDAAIKAQTKLNAAVAAVQSSAAPVAERISIEALFDELSEEQASVGAPIIDEAVNYVVMASDAVRHTFDRMISVLIKSADPRFLGGIFGARRQYIVVLPSEEVWQQYFIAINKGQADYVSFLRDYTFEVPSGGLFSHSRYVALTSLNGRNVVELKRTYDKDLDATSVMLRAPNGRVYVGKLDTHAYSPDYKIHSVKMSGWSGFSS